MKPSLLLLLAAGAAAAADEPVARVDGVAVSASDLAARLALARDAPANAVLQNLVSDVALAAEAERLGYAKDPRVTGAVDQERRRVAGERFMAKALAGIGLVDDATLRALFHDQQDAVKLRTIVLTTVEEAARAKERLAKGADFAAEARASLDAAGRGGTASWRTRAQLDPAMREAAFSAPLGAVSGPVALRLGAALFQVQERTIGSDKEFADKREALSRFAGEQMRSQARSHYVAQLRKQAGADIDEAFLRSTDKRLEATPAEAAHPVAKVYGKPVLYGEVLPDIRRLARNTEGGHYSGTSVKLEVVNLAVGQRAVEESALRAGQGTGPEVEAALAPVRRDTLVRIYTSDLRARAPRPTPAEVEAFYQQNLSQFRKPGVRSCAHILSRSRDLAEVAQKRLRGGQSFEEVARDLSADTATAAKGGALGPITDDQLQEMARQEADLAAAMKSPRPGAVIGPVKSRSGWHLLQCGAAQAATPAPLAEVTPAITEHLTNERGDDAIRARIAELRAKARISIDEAALQRAASRP